MTRRRTRPPPDGLRWGSAIDDGARDGWRGWFIGHFLASPPAGPAATAAMEVKCGVHPAGAATAIAGVNQTATTLSLLVAVASAWPSRATAAA